MSKVTDAAKLVLADIGATEKQKSRARARLLAAQWTPDLVRRLWLRGLPNPVLSRPDKVDQLKFKITRIDCSPFRFDLLTRELLALNVSQETIDSWTEKIEYVRRERKDPSDPLSFVR